MRYTAAKTNEINPGINSKEWDKALVGYINIEQWSGFSPVPDTQFRILRGPEGISVLFHTNEKNLRAECTEENGLVCKDSCMEFFFKPDPWNLNYINFEFNPAGIAHIGLGKDRYGRMLIDEDRSVFSIVSVANDGDWTLKFYIPDSFLKKYFHNIAPVCKGNFYKCGDETDHQHYGMWSPVETIRPDFHVPDFFGKIEL